MSDTDQLLSPTRSTRRNTRKTTTTEELPSATKSATKPKRKRTKTTDNTGTDSIYSVENEQTDTINVEPIKDTDTVLPTIHESDSINSMSGTLRQSRLSEKQTLSELNKRLEMYILKVRERDASSGSIDRELNILKQQYTTELQTQKQLYEQQINKLRNQKSTAVQEQTRLEYTVNEYNENISKLSNELNDYKERAVTSEQRVSELTQQLNELQYQLNDISGERDKLVKQVAELNKQLVTAQQTANTLQQQYDTVQLELKQISTKLTNALDDNELLQSTQKSEIELLNSKIHQLTEQQTTMEDVLRREFGKQLKQILEERQIQYEAEKNELMQELRDTYVQQLNERDAQIETQANQFTEQSDTLRQLEQRMLAERNQVQTALAERQTLEIRIQQLVTDLAAVNQELNTVVTQRNEQQRTYLQTIKRKDDEFGALMDVKVALDNEIRQYRVLLENEEYRLEDQMAAEEDNGYTQSANLIISNINKKSKLISVTNNEPYIVSLQGYSISVEDSGAEYKFAANVTLQPNDTIKISNKSSDSDTLYWRADDADIWSKGYKIQIRDVQDKVISEQIVGK